MIGDALTDLQAGQAAGVARTALVLSGRGAVQMSLPEAAKIRPLLTYNSLADALAEIN
jgi:phosphoglycolate phosphatase-like HAD superfamily hydrolase